jgi:hypothetical protein
MASWVDIDVEEEGAGIDAGILTHIPTTAVTLAMGVHEFAFSCTHGILML